MVAATSTSVCCAGCASTPRATIGEGDQAIRRRRAARLVQIAASEAPHQPDRVCSACALRRGGACRLRRTATARLPRERLGAGLPAHQPAAQREPARRRERLAGSGQPSRPTPRPRSASWARPRARSAKSRSGLAVAARIRVAWRASRRVTAPASCRASPFDATARGDRARRSVSGSRQARALGFRVDTPYPTANVSPFPNAPASPYEYETFAHPAGDAGADPLVTSADQRPGRGRHLHQQRPRPRRLRRADLQPAGRLVCFHQVSGDLTAEDVNVQSYEGHETSPSGRARCSHSDTETAKTSC